MKVSSAGAPGPDIVDEDIYRLMFEASPDWLEWRGTDQRCRLISPACETVTGYQPEDFLADPELLFKLIHPDDRQSFSEHLRWSLSQDAPTCEWEFRLLDRNGELRWISQKCRPLFRGREWIGQLIVNRDATTQKISAAELLHQNQALQAIINAPKDVILLIDRSMKIEHANQNLADRFGKQINEIIGKSILEALPLSPELARNRTANIQQVFETGQPVRVEDVGVSGVFDNFYFPVYDEQRTVRLVAVIARDMTQRKRIEDQLRRSNKIIQVLFNTPSDINAVFDLDGKIEMANDTLTRALNRAPGELNGKIIWDYFPPEMTRYRKAVVEKVIQSGMPQRLIDHGITGHYDSSAIPIKNELGQIELVAILARDISEQVKAQESLNQREAMLSSILNNAPVVLFVFDCHGVITYTDGQAIATTLKITKEQLIGQNVFDFPNTAQIFDEGIRTALEGQEYAAQITTINNHTFEARLTPLRNSTGEITGVIGVGIDVTENQKIQAELRRSKDELQTTLESIADAVFLSDAGGQIIYANQGALEMGNFASLQDLIACNGTPPGFIFSDESGKRLNQAELLAVRAAAIGKTEQTILSYRSSETSDERWLRIKVTPLFDENHQLQLAVSVFHDITEIKQAQAALEASHLELEKKIDERTAQLNLANQELVQRVAERRRAALHAEALANIAARVNLQTDLTSTLQAICEEVMKAVSYPYCSIYLYDEQEDELRLAAPTTLPDEYPVVDATPRDLYERYLRVYGPVIVIPDRQALPEKHGADLMSHYNVRTLISLPLVNNSELIGNLNVASKNQVRLPTQEELNLLAALADQATVAIAKAQLFDLVSEGRKRLLLLSEKLVEIQESERRNLARELHDEIGQLLTSLRLNLDLATRSIPKDIPSTGEAQKQLARANETASQLLGKIREISLDLRPTLLDDLGLLPALLTQFERFATRTNLQIHFKHSGLENRFSSQVETVAYRVIQEALTNVARHAKTHEAFVRLWADQEFLRLQVEDHGAGFDPQLILASNQTSGLSGMRERVNLCNGQLDIEAQPGFGTCLTVELPLHETAQA